MEKLMRAIVLDEFGEPDVLRVGEVASPEIRPGGVIVRVHAAGVNPVDVKARAGAAGNLFGAPPLVLGWDVSGVVEQVSVGVANLAVGDEVFGLVSFPEPGAAYAEYVSAPAHQLARKPESLDHAAAAGLPLAALTAQQGLDHARLENGQRVLVHAAAGGVGHLAVQIAKARGAYVIGTASAAKHEFVSELGADEIVDYTARPFEEIVGEVDVVLDLVGGDYAQRSVATLRRGGTLVVIAGFIDSELEQAAQAAGVQVFNHWVHPDGPGLRRIVELVERGELRLAVEHELPLEKAAEAHALSETERVRGKIVLVVQ